MITKPSGKSVNNIIVWVYEGPNGIHWRSSHKLLENNLEQKLQQAKEKGLAVIEALELVFRGVDLEEILEKVLN